MKLSARIYFEIHYSLLVPIYRQFVIDICLSFNKIS